jgi:hypothetical protein
MNKNYAKSQVSNNELSLQIENLSGNFSELIRTVSTMHEDISMSLKMLEVKQINTTNNVKVIKESIKEINKKMSMMNMNNSCYYGNCVSHSKKFSEEKKQKKEKRKKTDDFLFRPQRISKYPDTPDEAVREFRANTESDNFSSQSKEKFFQNIVPVDSVRREQRTDSFFSKNLKPMELLLDIPKNFDLDGLDDSCLKTPKKVEGERTKKRAIKEETSSSDENSHFLLKKQNQNNINIKNFDDFKMLLKDLKLTLNLSNYSTFNENFEENFTQLENTLHNYHILDIEIENLIESQKENQTSFADLLENTSIDNKKTKSVNFKPDKNSLIRSLTFLRDCSNFHLYENKLKDLKTNPSEFESFFIKIKKELESRRKKFDEIKTLFFNN